MKTSFRLFALLLTLIILLTDCKGALSTREIEIIIPDHPWEAASERLLWYELRIIGKKTQFKFIGTNQRNIKFKIPLGEGLLVLAYPMGECSPLGGWICPDTPDIPIVLDQMQGVLGKSLERIEPECFEDLNFPYLMSYIKEKTDDTREVSALRLLEDIANGKLKKTSIVLMENASPTDLEIPTGLWYSEFAMDGSFYVSQHQSPIISMYPGTLRYCNFTRNLMLTITLTDDLDFRWSVSTLKF